MEGAAQQNTSSPRSDASTNSLSPIGSSPPPTTPGPGRQATPLDSNRRGLSDNRVVEILDIASTTGDDPELDSLILRLHTETACRRGGALDITESDLDPVQSLMQLHEKGGTSRWQPVSPTLMRELLNHAQERPAPEPDTRLLRYRNGKPISRRRYDYLWQRLRKHLSWVDAQQISAH